MGSYFNIWMAVWICVVGIVGVGGYSKTPKQYHIQTDEGPDRYFRFQTFNGQYRKEKRFDDGTVVGTYGWVDPLGTLRLYDYIADHLGYRIVRQRTMQVPPIVEPPTQSPQRPFQKQPVTRPQSVGRPRPVTQSQQGTRTPVSRPQPVNRPIPPTQLRPVSHLRPRPHPSREASANSVPQTRPSPQPSFASQSPKLKPILIPLSQTGRVTRPVLEFQPVSPKPQFLSVRQTLPNLSPSPLQPFSNDVNVGKDIAGSPHTNPLVEETSPASQVFGERDSVKGSETSGVNTNTVSSRSRFRGRPLAQRRQPINRGTTRFRGSRVSSSVDQRLSKGFQSTQQSQDEGNDVTDIGTTTPDSHTSSGSASSDASARSIDSSIRRQGNTDSSFSTSSSDPGGLTTQSATNTDPTYDLPPDLPYSINYDLGNQFHMEKVLPDGTKVGKHGYVDPLGVLRVTHYNTGPNGHKQKHANKWVGTRHPEGQK